MSTRSIEELIGEIEARAVAKDGRLLVAIAGAPGSGKTTLSSKLAQSLGPHAAVLPMDGFHLDNETLIERSLLDRKGAPETFDARGFVDLLCRIQREASVTYPTFDREADSTIPDAAMISEDIEIVIVEGNYLLLKDTPWAELERVFDFTVMLQVSREELEQRLIQRWRDHGLSDAAAEARAHGNDMRNADYMLEHSRLPDLTVLHEG